MFYYKMLTTSFCQFRGKKNSKSKQIKRLRKNNTGKEMNRKLNNKIEARAELEKRKN